MGRKPWTADVAIRYLTCPGFVSCIRMRPEEYPHTV